MTGNLYDAQTIDDINYKKIVENTDKSKYKEKILTNQNVRRGNWIFKGKLTENGKIKWQ